MPRIKRKISVYFKQKSDIYKYAWQYMQGEIDLPTAKKLCFYEDWHLAKRQMTWLRKNNDYQWFEIGNLNNLFKYIEEQSV